MSKPFTAEQHETVRRHLAARYGHEPSTDLIDQVLAGLARCVWCGVLAHTEADLEPINAGPSLACKDMLGCAARQEATMTEAHRAARAAANQAGVRRMIEAAGLADEIDAEAEQIVSTALAAEGVQV